MAACALLTSTGPHEPPLRLAKPPARKTLRAGAEAGTAGHDVRRGKRSDAGGARRPAIISRPAVTAPMRPDRAGEACGRTRNATVFFGLAIRPGVSDRLARHRGLRPCDGARGNRGGALVDDSFCPAQARCTLRRDTVDLTLSPDLRGATHAEAESCTVEVLELTAAMEYAASWDRLLLDAAYANPFHGYVVLAAHAR